MSMDAEAVNRYIEIIARTLEMIGVAVVAVSFAHALARAMRHFGQKRHDAYERLKVYLGRALLLGLEFLVAADIIRTVIIAPTSDNLLSLGLLVLVRIVLGWSIAVEIDGCWPWQAAALGKTMAGKSGSSH